MKKIHIKFFLILAVSALLLFSCDYLSQTGNMTEVMIPLFSDDSSRAIGKTGLDITITGFTIRVFGPGMQPIAKEVGATARYVNIYIPAGEDRHISVEAHFVSGADFVPKHVRSFIGRATVDLRPGRYSGVTFNMVAGATELLAPDNLGNSIYYADSLDAFTANNVWGLTRISPTDIEVSAEGYLFISNNYSGNENITIWQARGLPSGLFASGSIVTSLAMDRDAQYDLDGNTVVDQSILYYSIGGTLYFTVVDNGTSTSPIAMDMTGTLNSILGMAVDPWTHLLYISGSYTPPNGTAVRALVVYEPLYHPTRAVFGRYVTHITHADFSDPYDVIVKDEGIFILNGSSPRAPYPSILQFDRNLNFIGSYGSPSVNGSSMEASTAPGKFYYPRRFFAQENQGLYIIDDSNVAGSDGNFDKLIHINANLSSPGWQTFPATQVPNGPTGEPFDFYMQ